MKRFWILTGTIVAMMLLLFFLVGALDLPWLQEDSDWLMARDSWVAGLTGVGLLVVDVIAPVPSSIVMFVHGALFGIIWGTLLSLAGGLGAAWAGHWMGRRGLTRGKRWMGEAAHQRTHRFFARHGLVAVIISRPIPLLAEAVSITAGLSGMSTRKFLLGSGLGLLPTALMYAIAGAWALDFAVGLYALGAVVLVASLVWFIGWRFMRSDKPHPAAH